jgi:hypothetical protein
MIERLDVQPNDRILLLSIPGVALVIELAELAGRGIVVALSGAEEVYAARRATRDHENIMFVPATPDEIPWQEGFFSKVVDLQGETAPSALMIHEIVRVLSPGGLACLSAQDVQPFVAAGLIKVSSAEGLHILRKPGCR